MPVGPDLDWVAVKDGALREPMCQLLDTPDGWGVRAGYQGYSQHLGTECERVRI